MEDSNTVAITPADFATRWHTFLKRKTLVIGRPLGFSFGPALSIAFAPLQEIVASLLYVDLVSLLEMGTSTQMSGRKFDGLEDLKERLEYLAGQGRILDVAALHEIRLRRNEIGHQVVQVSPAELDTAVPVVQRQLEAWGLVGPAPAYQFYFERGAMRELTEQEKADRPGFDWSRKYHVGVQREKRWVLEYSWTEYLGSPSHPG
jgi:hypothetical protein